MRSSIQRFALMAILTGAMTTFFSAGAALSQALDLFRAATPPDIEAAAGASKRAGAARERVSALNDGALADAPALRITLFPGVVATFSKTGSETADGGGRIWTGSDGAGGEATLVFARGKVTGQVQLDGRAFEIRGAGGSRAHRIIEVDAARLPPEGPLTVPKDLPERKSGTLPDASSAAAAGRTRITVLIAYTEAAKAAADDILAEADLAVSLANQGYKASGVKIRLKLAGTVLVTGYDESSVSWEDTLNNLSGSTDAPNPAPFAGVRKKRNRTEADLVVLLRSESQPAYCGLGHYIEEPGSGTSKFAYSEVELSCVSNHSVAHEMGHNMGLNHDRYVVGSAPKSAYNFGYVLPRKRVRSIMAYNNRCADAGFNCTRLNRFSDPDATVENKPFGVEQGEKGAADAARRLNETRTAIAAYR